MCRIAVDIDDTLYSFAYLARKVMTKIGFEERDRQMIAAAYAEWPEWRSPVDLLGEERWLEVIHMCHDDDLIIAQKPFEGAAETCRALVEAGHELLYISNRAHERTEATHCWLDINGFTMENTEVMCLMGDKTPHIADCQYFIDDRPKNLVNFVYDFQWQNKYGSQNEEKARRGFGLMTPFNRSLTDCPRIYLAPTWSGLNYYLATKGLLKEEVEVSV